MDAIDERFELLRDGLRNAAIHSPSARTRWAAAACLDAPDAMAIIRVVQSLSCTYAPGLRQLATEFWRHRNAKHR